MDRRPLALGEYVFYGIATLTGLLLVADFIYAFATGGTPSTPLIGVFGTMMALFATVPRGYRRGRDGDDK